MDTYAAGRDAGLELLWDGGAQPPLPVRRRSRVGRALSALVLVAALVAGGLAGVRYAADADLRASLTASTRAFNTAVLEMTSVSSAEKAALSAGTATAAARDVNAALLQLDAVREPRERAVREQLQAESRLLLALGSLGAVATAPLVTWGAAHAELTAAVRAEASSRSVLERHHRGAGARLADTGLLLSELTAAVAPALVDDATGESVRLLKTLRSANTTADLRALGDAALVDQPAVAAAAQTLPAGERRQILAGYAAGLAAFGDLAAVDGESTGGWALTRAELERSFGQVAAAGSIAGRNVLVVLDDALTAGDAVVVTAATAVAEWKAQTQAALAAQQADADALDAYADRVRLEAARYGELQLALAGFLARPTQPAAPFLAQAAQDRRQVQDAVLAAAAPEAMSDAHQQLVAALDLGLDALEAASGDARDGDAFVAEVAASDAAYDAAVIRWEADVVATTTAIAERTPPVKPDV